jgi:glycosyltransferase involved in cell wall biosynthesis
LATDSENRILADEGWKKFDHFVFVSQWQRDMYIAYHGLPYSKCTVIPNTIETQFQAPLVKDMDKIRFIYHTTPHRGLQLVYPIFDALTKEFDNIHLDVYSSFEIYGWKQRDKPFQDLFEQIKIHPNMTYHGSVSNEEVLEALQQSHIFMYPCIWQETSCIALIEAIRNGLICIHPNYGALLETSDGATVVYDYTENTQDHANLCYVLTKNILLHIKNDDRFFENYTRGVYSLPRHNINSFSQSWNNLLEKLNNERK